MGTFARIRGRALRELDAWRSDLEGALVESLGAAQAKAVVDDARARLDGMLEGIPDPGWAAPHMRAFTLTGAIYVAVYLALAERGWDPARAWAACEVATIAHLARMSPIQKKLTTRALFAWPMKALSRRQARQSRKAPIGGWVFDFVDGEPGRFEFGVDYDQCAIRALAAVNGAAAFAPYICLSDVPASEALGWGLERTETLAQGGARCDFRFRRGGETKVRVRLPVAPEK